MLGTTQVLESCAANPPGAGLVTLRRAAQIEIVEPKIPQQPHTPMRDKDSLAFASPVYIRYPLIYSWVPQLMPGHQVPCRLEQCE